MYYLITNVAEHTGRVEEIDADELWSNENPDGVTLQSLAGPGATVVSEFESYEDAEAALSEFLECPAAERGEYCYTHNPAG